MTTIQNALLNAGNYRAKTCKAYLTDINVAPLAAELQIIISLLSNTAAQPGICNTYKIHLLNFRNAYASMMALLVKKGLPRASLSG